MRPLLRTTNNDCAILRRVSEVPRLTPALTNLCWYSQPFWGDMVAAAGAGPKPIHHQALDAQNLAEAIQYCLNSVAVAAAATLAAKIHREKGVNQAVDSFHQQVARCHMGCDVLPNHPAVWGYKKSNGRLIKLSKLAAEVLSEHSEIEKHKLVLSVIPSCEHLPCAGRVLTVWDSS